MKTIEDDIVSLFEAAQRNVLIVAPFIRSEALARLLDSIPSGTETIVVTRWRIADLLAGASDLGVYELTEAKRIPLYLRPDLHAKLFAADESCLVGSANVTDTALGRRKQSNLELLVLVPRGADSIVEFEKQLLAQAVRASGKHRDRLDNLLERLRLSKTAIVGMENESFSLTPSNWVPQVRNPEELYAVYQGNADLGRSAIVIMQEELAKIGVVAGLNEEEFKAWVAVKIGQSPFIERVIQKIEEHGEVTEADIGELLTESDVAPNEYQPRDLLEVLERWLTCFLSMRYETARDSVRLIKAKML